MTEAAAEKEAEKTVEMTPAEKQASQQGWTDKDTWVEKGGDPDKWRDAETFLQVGKEIDWKGKNAALRQEIDALKKGFEDFQNFKQAAVDRANKRRDEAIAALKEAKAAAVESGDKKAYLEAEDQLEREQEAKRKAESQSQQLTPITQAFVTRNADWFQKDEQATRYADVLGPVIQAENPGITEADYYAELESRVLARFPRNGQTPSKKTAEVDTGQRGGGTGNGSARTFENLPKEAQRECDAFVAQIPNYTREQYVKDYEWED